MLNHADTIRLKVHDNVTVNVRFVTILQPVFTRCYFETAAAAANKQKETAYHSKATRPLATVEAKSQGPCT
jgi:hypothetical protein